MVIILIILLIFASILLIGAILIQPGKGDMLSGMGGVSTQFNSAMGTKNAANFLSRATWGLAAFIIVGTVLVNLIYSGGSVTSTKQTKSATESVIPNYTPSTPLNNTSIQNEAPANSTPTEVPPASENSKKDKKSE